MFFIVSQDNRSSQDDGNLVRHIHDVENLDGEVDVEWCYAKYIAGLHNEIVAGSTPPVGSHLDRLEKGRRRVMRKMSE